MLQEQSSAGRESRELMHMAGQCFAPSVAQTAEYAGFQVKGIHTCAYSSVHK